MRQCQSDNADHIKEIKVSDEIHETKDQMTVWLTRQTVR